MKRVFYNGRKANEYPSQPSSDLRTGTVYEVIGEVESGEQHNFILKGMPSGVGYNSDWFKVVPVYVASASEVPTVGESLGNILRFETDYISAPTAMVVDEKILHIYWLGENLYEVHTKFVTYILMIKTKKV